MLWSFVVFKLHLDRVKGTKTFIQAEGTLKAWNLVVFQPKVKEKQQQTNRDVTLPCLLEFLHSEAETFVILGP